MSDWNQGGSSPPTIALPTWGSPSSVPMPGSPRWHNGFYPTMTATAVLSWNGVPVGIAPATARVTSSLALAGIPVGRAAPVAVAGATLALAGQPLGLAASTRVANAVLTLSGAYPATGPTTTQITTSQTVPIPYWAVYIDVIAVGPGGGATGGGWAVNGAGGGAGTFAAITIARGFTASPTSLTVALGTVGVGGAGGASPTTGGNATATTITWSGGSLTANGGIGGNQSNATGQAAGTYVFLATSYVGGAAQATTDQNGNPYGGGGAGGKSVVFAGDKGGNGAPSCVWIVFRQ